MNLKKITKKEKKEKAPKTKRLSQKKANRLVFSVFSVIAISSVVGVVRANVVATNFDNLANKVEKISGKMPEEQSNQEFYDYAALSFYATNFVKEYMDYDASADEDKKKERLERLADYLSMDVETIDETGKTVLDFSRKFKEASLVQVKEENACLLVYVNVTYEVTMEDKTETITQDMVLPIQTKNQLFSIVSRPYFLAAALPQGKTEALTQGEESIEVPTQEKEAIEKFLTMFFEKYADADKQEMMLLMKEPVQTTGTTEFVSVDFNEVHYFETNQEDVQGIQVSVTFVDKKTSLTHTEDFSLWITQTENSYFVNTLKHYFTEEEGNL